MSNPHFEEPQEIEVAPEDLALIDCGIRDAEEGRTISLEDARNLISRWRTKSESPNEQ